MRLEEFAKSNNFKLPLEYLYLLKIKYFTTLFEKVSFEDSKFDIKYCIYKGKIKSIKSDDFSDVESFLNEYRITDNRPIGIGEIYEHQDLTFKVWTDFVKHHRLFSSGFLPIGTINNPHSSLLLLGINERNNGSIWMEVSNSFTLLKLEHTLFEFLNNLHFYFDDFLTDRIDLAKLYKNWGEEFWRVRD